MGITVILLVLPNGGGTEIDDNTTRGESTSRRTQTGTSGDSPVLLKRTKATRHDRRFFNNETVNSATDTPLAARVYSVVGVTACLSKIPGC